MYSLVYLVSKHDTLECKASIQSMPVKHIECCCERAQLKLAEGARITGHPEVLSINTPAERLTKG
jgi:hypothetical protein